MIITYTCDILGVGSVDLCKSDGRNVTVTNVRHVSGLKTNLVAPGVLDDSRCTYSK